MHTESVRPEHRMILIIDASDSVSTILTKSYPNIITAINLDDILKLLKTIQFDLILLDFNRLNLDFITQIKNSKGNNKKTPIIALFNDNEIQHSDADSFLEYDDRLNKPITKQKLDTIIACWQKKYLALDYIQILLSKTKNNQQLAKTIFEKLFDELPIQILQIKEAIENGQYDNAQDTTHKLNGSVSFCGLIDIQHPAKALESCLLNKNYADLNQQFLLLQQRTVNFTSYHTAIMTHLDKMYSA